MTQNYPINEYYWLELITWKNTINKKNKLLQIICINNIHLKL